MSARIIVGDYQVEEGDVIITDFHPDIIKKKNTDTDNAAIVLYVDSLKLKKTDVEYIMKHSTRNVILVCETKKSLHGARKHKNATIEYSKDYSPAASPFDVALLIATASDRKYVHEFLKYNKVQMYMVVKTLISNYMYMKHKCNHKSIAWLDENLYKVSPEFLWAYAAHRFKPERLRFMKWNYPKKVDNEDG